MNKGHTAAESLEQLKRLDKAGIGYTLFYIFGMGGKGTGSQCGIDAARLFKAAHPRRIVSTGMTVTEGTGAAAPEKEGKFTQVKGKIVEMRTFPENLEVDAFYDGVHMLNPLHLRFRANNAVEKRKAISQIDNALNTYSDGELEQAINRAAMAEASAPKR